MQKPGLRKPRFIRSPTGQIRLTGRDMRILDLADRYRLIRSDHLTKLISGSVQHLTRRLGKLFHAGFLDRPLDQRLLRKQSNEHIACCITTKGQRELHKQGVKTFATAPRFRAASAILSMTHTLRVSDIVAAFEGHASTRNLRFIPHHEWDGFGAADVAAVGPLRWGVGFPDAGHFVRCGVRPDSAFAIESPDGDRRYFLLEVDRGTMPITRSDPLQSSIRKKVLAYKATRHHGILWKRFKVPGFRVLFVAESKKRLSALQAATSSCFQRGSTSMFLFATVSDVVIDAFSPWASCTNYQTGLCTLADKCGFHSFGYHEIRDPNGGCDRRLQRDPE